MTERVRLPAAVAEQLEEVRLDGRVNMLDRDGVPFIADDLGHYELVVWVEDHRRQYGRMILEGFEVEDALDG